LQVKDHASASLLQLGASRSSARSFLQSVEGSQTSIRLTKAVALIAGNNPFATVLKNIDAMISVIGKEGQADKENLDWCGTERTSNDESRTDKADQIFTLEEDITKLEKLIDDPESGLKVQISQTEESLRKTVQSQTTQTASRMEENRAYQENIGTLVKAEEILAKAIKVLKKYYVALSKQIAESEGGNFLQNDPAPPDTFGTFKGQGEKGGDAIDMLVFILGETKKEELEAHNDEESAQRSYEDSMSDLKGEEAGNQKNIVSLKKQLADKEKELIRNENELKDTVADKEAIEAYLMEIKPGCDFIVSNFDLREQHRKTEKDALEKAVRMLKDTPTYKDAETKSKVDSLGDCKDVCLSDSDHANCKACLARVTVPAYCAGHSETTGC